MTWQKGKERVEAMQLVSPTSAQETGKEKTELLAGKTEVHYDLLVQFPPEA